MSKNLPATIAAGVALILVLAVVLVQCSPDRVTQPAPVITITEPVSVPPAASSTAISPELQRAAIRIAWDDMNVSDQGSLCAAFTADPEYVLDRFLSQSGGRFDRWVVRGFFAEVCGQ